MLKTLAAVLFTLLIALPIKAQVGPGLGRSDYQGTSVGGMGGRGTYAQACTRSRDGRLSLRTGPGINYRKIKEISNGHTLALFNGRYSQDGFWWWKVAHNGNTGWVRADYVCGDPQ